MKVVLKKGLELDVIIHPDGWMVTERNARKILCVGRNVAGMNRRNNPGRYRRGTEYVMISDVRDFMINNFEKYEFDTIMDNRICLWTRKGIMVLANHLRNVQKDWIDCVNEIEDTVKNINN